MNENLPDTPAAIGPEKSILSMMLQHPADFIPRALGDGLTEDHFHLTKPIFRLIAERHRAGRSMDLTTLVTEEHAAGNIDACGGPTAIYDVFTYAPTTGGYTQHLRLLREWLVKRRARTAAADLSKIDDGSDPEEIQETIRRALEGVTSALSAPGGMVTAKAASKAFLDALEEAYENGDLPGQATGVEVIDFVSGGLRPGQLWVICAETSGGKSVLMLQIAANTAAAGKHVLIFSLEMEAREIIGRCISYHGRVENQHIIKPRSASKHSLGKIQGAVQQISEWKMWIDDRSNQTVNHIEAECIRQRDLHGPVDLVIVDYLQLVRGERGRQDKEHEEISRVSKGLKNLAKTLQCPVITAAQLNDNGKVKGSREPTFDADAVLLIGSDGIKVGKLRNAERNMVLPLLLNGQFQRFDRCEPQPEPAHEDRNNYQQKRYR